MKLLQLLCVVLLPLSSGFPSIGKKNHKTTVEGYKAYIERLEWSALWMRYVQTSSAFSQASIEISKQILEKTTASPLAKKENLAADVLDPLFPYAPPPVAAFAKGAAGMAVAGATQAAASTVQAVGQAAAGAAKVAAGAGQAVAAGATQAVASTVQAVGQAAAGAAKVAAGAGQAVAAGATQAVASTGQAAGQVAAGAGQAVVGAGQAAAKLAAPLLDPSSVPAMMTNLLPPAKTNLERTHNAGSRKAARHTLGDQIRGKKSHKGGRSLLRDLEKAAAAEQVVEEAVGRMQGNVEHLSKRAEVENHLQQVINSLVPPKPLQATSASHETEKEELVNKMGNPVNLLFLHSGKTDMAENLDTMHLFASTVQSWTRTIYVTVEDILLGADSEEVLEEYFKESNFGNYKALVVWKLKKTSMVWCYYWAAFAATNDILAMEKTMGIQNHPISPPAESVTGLGGLANRCRFVHWAINIFICQLLWEPTISAVKAAKTDADKKGAWLGLMALYVTHVESVLHCWHVMLFLTAEVETNKMAKLAKKAMPYVKWTICSWDWFSIGLFHTALAEAAFPKMSAMVNKAIVNPILSAAKGMIPKLPALPAAAAAAAASPGPAPAADVTKLTTQVEVAVAATELAHAEPQPAPVAQAAEPHSAPQLPAAPPMAHAAMATTELAPPAADFLKQWFKTSQSAGLPNAATQPTQPAASSNEPSSLLHALAAQENKVPAAASAPIGTDATAKFVDPNDMPQPLVADLSPKKPTGNTSQPAAVQVSQLVGPSSTTSMPNNLPNQIANVAAATQMMATQGGSQVWVNKP